MLIVLPAAFLFWLFGLATFFATFDLFLAAQAATVGGLIGATGGGIALFLAVSQKNKQ